MRKNENDQLSDNCPLPKKMGFLITKENIFKIIKQKKQLKTFKKNQI